ncbi:hypothetical protein B7C62_16275 [Kitasatospora albolonga]|uniref:Peptidoglycan-binding protein n=2 Tax=Kitasatospora albolonga TaxID=68173 RepID=A0ABC8BTR8_9ACTN|nr:hypothetical protein B7C62_16275 [Kitasatospora albolonga]
MGGRDAYGQDVYEQDVYEQDVYEQGTGSQAGRGQDTDTYGQAGHGQGTPAQVEFAQGTPAQGTPAQGTPAQVELAQGAPAQDVSADAGASRLAGRRRWVVAIAVVAAVLAASGVGASAFVKSPAEAAAAAEAPPPDVLTAPVERRVLKDTLIVRGTVKATQVVDVSPGESGDTAGRAVVTRVVKNAGDAVGAGDILLEVSGRPVFALPGALPVYRDLRPGTRGPDVEQLQKALRGFGHSTAPDRPGTFGTGTGTALTAFYGKRGHEPRPAHEDGAEALKTARQAVTDAERQAEDTAAAVTRATRATGAADTGSAGDPKGAADGESIAELRTAAARAAQDLTAARADLADEQGRQGPLLPASEVVYATGFPARVESLTADVGSAVSGGVMRLSSGELVVEAHVPESQVGLLKVGQGAEVHSELDQRPVPAGISFVGDAPARERKAGADSEGLETRGGSPGYPVRITAKRPLADALSGREVRVTVAAARSKGEVLAVPVTALVSDPDGSTAVSVLRADGRRDRVEVRTGMEADGLVEVTPVNPADPVDSAGRDSRGGRDVRGGLDDGDRVVIGIRPSGDEGPAGEAP